MIDLLHSVNKAAAAPPEFAETTCRSECMSTRCSSACSVEQIWALTNKPYTIRVRPWEKRKTRIVDVIDCVRRFPSDGLKRDRIG